MGVSNLDLNNLLDGWSHEPGQVKARKIAGNDGREKLQLRIDLGLIQMELQGRPDGERPFGYESLLQYHQSRASMALTRGTTYELVDSDLVGLQQEAVQYYHRYLSLFQLQDYPNVVRGIVDVRWHSKVARDECHIRGTEGERLSPPMPTHTFR